MATETHKVVINLATGLEDAERVMIAFLVGGAAVEQGKRVTTFLTKDAVKLAIPGIAETADDCARLPAPCGAGVLQIFSPLSMRSA
jgi:predicted peroxiredoxin